MSSSSNRHREREPPQPVVIERVAVELRQTSKILRTGDASAELAPERHLRRADASAELATQRHLRRAPEAEALLLN